MLAIRHNDTRGRGVYATSAIEPQTVVERSPVLLFDKEEYETHGKYTILDHYTFNWKVGRMALALGLGSLFNHSASPNTSFTLKPHPDTPTIEFTVLRRVEPGEELCIFYGHKLWFTPDNEADNPQIAATDDDEDPFDLLKMPEDIEPKDTVQTIEAWVLDAPHTRDVNALLGWTRRAGLDRELRHLKRIRRIQNDGEEPRISLLLCAANTPVPPLPDEYASVVPYTLAVPARPALTMAHLALKNAVWPTVYAPVRPDPDEVRATAWTSARRAWARECVREVVRIAEAAKEAGEIPSAALLPRNVGEDETSGAVTASTHDTRTSEQHPLRHAVMNLVRLVGSLHQHQNQSHGDNENKTAAASAEYFLTGRALFLTHEPCVMCSMALVHSRVRDVYILRPMPQTGGAGGELGRMVVGLPNINHRYRIWRWNGVSHPELDISDSLDA